MSIGSLSLTFALTVTSVDLLTGATMPYIQQYPATAMDWRDAVIQEHEYIEERVPDFDFAKINALPELPPGTLTIDNITVPEVPQKPLQRYESRRKQYQAAIRERWIAPIIAINCMEYVNGLLTFGLIFLAAFGFGRILWDVWLYRKHVAHGSVNQRCYVRVIMLVECVIIASAFSWGLMRQYADWAEGWFLKLAPAPIFEPATIIFIVLICGAIGLVAVTLVPLRFARIMTVGIPPDMRGAWAIITAGTTFLVTLIGLALAMPSLLFRLFKVYHNAVGIAEIQVFACFIIGGGSLTLYFVGKAIVYQWFLCAPIKCLTVEKELLERLVTTMRSIIMKPQPELTIEPCEITIGDLIDVSDAELIAESQTKTPLSPLRPSEVAVIRAATASIGIR